MAMKPEDQELLHAIRKRLEERLSKNITNNDQNPKPRQRFRKQPSCLEDLFMLNNILLSLEKELSHVFEKQTNSIL